MKCAYHPDKDATAKCSHCKKPLCGQCAIPGGDNSFICSRCVAVEAAREVTQDTHERLEDREIKRQLQQEKKKKRAKTIRIIFLSLAMLTMIANVILYFGNAIPGEEQFIPSEYPIATTIIIDQAIRDYSKDNEGKIPQELDELLGRYIPVQGIAPQDLEGVSYRRISPHSFELYPKKSGEEPIPSHIFTEEGSE